VSTGAQTKAGKAGQRLVALLLAVTSAGYLCRVAVTVVDPGMMREFGLTQTQMGTVFSAFLIGYTLFQIPSGWLADRASCRVIFLWICAGWALLTFLTAVAAWHGLAAVPAIPQLWAIRILFGVVTAPTYPTAIRTIAVTLPARVHARANGVVFASLGLGSALTPVLLAPVSGRFGWRAALMVAAFLAGAAGLLWARFAPREFHQASDEGPIERPSKEIAKGENVLGSASYWVLCASYVLESYLGYIFIFWFYLYLVQVRQFEVLKAASVTALPWVATIFAIPLGGLASDLAVKRWGATWGRRSVPLTALCAAAIFLVWGARTASSAVAVGALTMCTVLVLCTEGAFWATMAEMSGKQSGLAGGVMNFGGNLGGVISPALTPWMAARIGWESALTVTAVLAVVAGVLWLGVWVRSSGNDQL
jgi:ACS family glucarate transporter-like MFS transporter